MTKITRNRVKIIKAFSAAPELQAAVKDSFSKADQEQEFFKALQIIGLEIEKAHIVGDVFFQGGKQYVWKEYAPGKFDWRIANKTTGVIKGKGINGKHGKAAIEKAFADVDPSYTDPQKMLLRRTPAGHWRLYYDGNDAGTTIAGDALTESEMRSEDMAYQGNRIVDNFKLVDNYMEFNSPDDVYFVQVIKRWKDNKDKPNAEAWRQAGKIGGTYHSGAEYLNYYLIHSPQELDAVRDEIIKACSYNNARAYVSINSRSQSQVNNYIGKFKSRFNDPNDPRVKHAEAILYGMAKTGPAWRDTRPRVLLDIDTVRDSEVTIKGKKVNVWDETRRRLKALNIKVVAEYETPSGGLHLILNNKNNRNLKPFYHSLRDFDGGRDLDRLATVHPSEDIKMVLYSNVDTAGY